MSVYIVLLNEGFGYPKEFDDRDKAAAFCWDNKIPHFYESKELFATTPLRLWDVLPAAEGDKPYSLSSREWAKVVESHGRFGGATDLQGMEKHQHKTDVIARGVLKRMARRAGKPYSEAIKAFRGQDEGATMEFWRLLNESNPGQFNRVYYCHGCRKFNLYAEADVTSEA